MIKRLIKCIFVCFMFVFVMSLNVSAFTLNENIQIIDVTTSPRVAYYNGSSWSNLTSGFTTFTSSSGNFTQIRVTKSDFTSVDNFQMGDYIILNGFFTANRLVLSGANFETVGGFIGSTDGSVSCPIVDLHFGAVQEYAQSSGGNQESWYRSDFQLTCKIISNNLSWQQYINFRIRPDIFNVAGTRLNIDFTSGIVARNSSDSKKEENAANENIEEGNTESESSSDEATESTSSLISAIGSFVGAVTTATPTNCNIDGDMGNFDMGQIDLCANPVPSFIQIISSLILIVICIPFAIVMFNRFINLFRSFQE